MPPSNPPELAIEVINLIIDQLRNTPSDLKTCALVCRDWVPQSRYHLFQHINLDEAGVSVFLKLCSSPHSTLPLARIRSLYIDSEFMYEGSDDSDYPTSPAFDQLLTWQSPNGQKELITDCVLKHLQTLSLFETVWDTLSGNARMVLLQGFTTLRELDLWQVVFGSEEDFIELMRAFKGLQRLGLGGVSFSSVRNPNQGQLDASSYLPPSLRAIDMPHIRENTPVGTINLLIPCRTLKSFDCAIRDTNPDTVTGFVKAISRLIGSAGHSLEKFDFQLQCGNELWRDMDCDALLHHIDFTTNPNLQCIALDVNTDSYIVPFLRRLTRSSNPPSLKQLHLPRLDVDEHRFRTQDVDSPELIDEILQHPYFSSLEEVRCTVVVKGYRSRNLQGQLTGWRSERSTDEGTDPTKEMELQIEKLKSRMPGLVKRGVLKICQDFQIIEGGIMSIGITNIYGLNDSSWAWL